MIEEIQRVYKAVDTDIPLYADPHPDATQIDVMAAGSTVEVTEREHHWVKATGKEGKTGWGAATMMERIMNVPAPDLEFYSNGHKIIDGKYRNFFGISNAGLADFTGDIALRLYSGSTLVGSENYTFANAPIAKSGGKSFHVDTNAEAKKFEFEAAGEVYAGPTKGLNKQSQQPWDVHSHDSSV